MWYLLANMLSFHRYSGYPTLYTAASAWKDRKTSEKRKWTESSRYMAQKMFSIHDFCTFNLKNHFILERTFSLTASTVCLSIQPTPDTRSLKARMIPSIITSTWKGDTLWSPWQQKIQRRKSFELLYVTRVPTPNPGRRRFKNRYESCFLPFLCCPDRTHFW